jgi:hypothetical protein
MKARIVAQAVATACGKQHYIFQSMQQQQQQVQLSPATQQGLKHWMQVSQSAGVADILPDLWAGNAAGLEDIIGRAFAAGFGRDLEESTPQQYVRTSRKLC